jgi:enamine deaminase RidA (YjgF/YER057c/UK114 family)
MMAPSGGHLLFVAGQTATDESGRIAATGLTAQFDRSLERVLAVVRAAGGRSEHIARMTVFVTSMENYRDSRAALREVWQHHMGSHYPAMALVEVTALVDPDAIVEIEATAVLP